LGFDAIGSTVEVQGILRFVCAPKTRILNRNVTVAYPTTIISPLGVNWWAKAPLTKMKSCLWHPHARRHRHWSCVVEGLGVKFGFWRV
jgi:hypothetical protein